MDTNLFMDLQIWFITGAGHSNTVMLLLQMNVQNLMRMKTILAIQMIQNWSARFKARYVIFQVNHRILKILYKLCLSQVLIQC